jgi:hypothetical protein
MRVKMSSDTIKRTLRASGASHGMRSEAGRVLNQLGEIHYIRDRLAHNAAYHDESNSQGWFYTNNNITIRENEQADVIRFKLEVLANMTADLERIPDLLERALFPESTKIIDVELRADPVHSQHVAALYAPWRYKLSQLRKLVRDLAPLLKGVGASVSHLRRDLDPNIIGLASFVYSMRLDLRCPDAYCRHGGRHARTI